MATVDLIIVGIVGLSLLFGAFRGLVKEALSLGFWIGGAVVASAYSPGMSVHLEGLISNPAAQRIAAFVLIFVFTVFLGGLITNAISKLTSRAGLGAVDRGLGALFGILRGVVIVTVVVVLTVQFELTREPYARSTLVPYVLELAEYFQNLLGLAPVASPGANIRIQR